MKGKTTKPKILQEPPAGYNELTIVIYETPDGVRVDIKLEKDTLWLSQKQMAELFETERSVITKHLRNIFNSGELIQDTVCANFALTASDGKKYRTALYNLDAVISVGYRVNSKRGTQFRIWATSVLRDHLLKGYSVNDLRLRELNQTIRLIADVASRRELSGDEAKALLSVVSDYSFALDLLDDYDHQRVAISVTTPGAVKPLDYGEARRIVNRLGEKFGDSDLFGREKDESLKGALGAVMQTFGGRDVYPGIEEKAANLLYFLIKDHPFVDGNKRIGAALFLWFLEKNEALYRPDGIKRIADTALVAMTLLIAESKPAEKDLLTRVLINLINWREAEQCR
ncbi:MAG: virulence protein RhuM/Fic/DOC family protein [Syntrophus sp. (in: bacteria)]